MTITLKTVKAFEAEEVELLEHKFSTVALTKSVEDARDEIVSRIEKEADDADEQLEAAARRLRIIDLYGQILDLLLKATDGTRLKPSRLIADAYAAEKITFAHIEQFASDIAEAISQDPS